jgi:putative membrane-bound dehydrogenase-like protein
MRVHSLLASLIFSSNLVAAEGLKSRTTYNEAYGKTRNAVSVDPEKELPRYPAMEPSAALETWKIKDGFRIEFTAHEPQVRDPIAMCFDERGRLFVCEMIDYSEMRDVSPHLGRISMLEDKDGDGFYETHTIFADDLPWPTGLIWANGGLYVGATPDIWRFEDRDGDGKAEFREKVFAGFGTGLKILNVQGLLNSFQWGQDNRIHVLSGGGNRGIITCPKRPDLPGQELGGQDFWFDPLSLSFGTEPGGAQYGMSYDNYGRKFGCSNSDHLQSWVYGTTSAPHRANAYLPPSRQSIATDGGAAEVYRISPDEPWRILRTRWRISGTVPGAVEGGGRVSGYFTGATGTTIYRGDAYGSGFVNNSFTGDAGGQLVHRKIITPASDGVMLSGSRPSDELKFEFAASKDTWVRVVNFANAPDGCLHVLDMYREVIEHPWSIPDEIKRNLDLNSGNDRGRIYRIVPKTGAPRIGKPVELHKAATAELVQLLEHPNGWHRDTAQRLLYERQDLSALPALEALCKRGNPLAVIHAMSAIAGLKSPLTQVLPLALAHSDTHVRRRAIELAAIHAAELRNDDSVVTALAKCASDENPLVRFQLALAMPEFLADSPVSKLIPVLTALAQKDHAHPWIASALLGCPPQLLRMALFEPLARDSMFISAAEGFMARLIEIRAASDPPDQRLNLIRFLSEGKANPSWIQALGNGLQRIGLTIGRADTEGNLRAIFSDAAVRAADASTDIKVRLTAIETVGLGDRTQFLPPLTACLQAVQPDGIQSAAIKTLGKDTAPEVTDIILKHWKSYGLEATENALQVLLTRTDRTIRLLREFESGALNPTILSPARIQTLIKHKDPKIAELSLSSLASVLPPSRSEVMAKYIGAVMNRGDAERGRSQFDTRCAVCHRVSGTGNEVGPDLVTVKNKGREALLSAILDPNKEVAAQYIVYNVTTKSGDSFTGIVTDDSASSMTLKMAGGITQKIERSHIQGTSSAGQSLMPEGIEGGMSVADMADLLSFIEALQ